MVGYGWDKYYEQVQLTHTLRFIFSSGCLQGSLKLIILVQPAIPPSRVKRFKVALFLNQIALSDAVGGRYHIRSKRVFPARENGNLKEVLPELA